MTAPALVSAWEDLTARAGGIDWERAGRELDESATQSSPACSPPRNAKLSRHCIQPRSRSARGS
jgi:hypothetical protein